MRTPVGPARQPVPPEDDRPKREPVPPEHRQQPGSAGKVVRFKDLKPTRVRLPIEALVRRRGATPTTPTEEGWPRYLDHCPAHSDDSPSLTWFQNSRGLYKFNCFAGCLPDDIERAMLTWLAAHATPPPPSRTKGSLGPIVKTYDYRDLSRAVRYQVTRHVPKTFRVRRPDGDGGWVWGLGDEPPLLYHLPELQGQSTVYSPAGEKDCETLERLGLVATTNALGEGHWLADHVEHLKAAGCTDLIVLADNDPPDKRGKDGKTPGERGAEVKARSCAAGGMRVKVIRFDVKDVSDWVAAGHTRDELDALVAATPIWAPEPGPSPASPTNDERPPVVSIVVNNLQLREKTTLTLDALRQYNGTDPFIFQQGDVLVRLRTGGTSTQILTEESLRHVASRAANWFRTDEHGAQHAITPPSDIMSDLLATLDPKLPSLVAFRTVPYFAPDGRLIIERGYNADTRIYLSYPPSLVLAVPEPPTFKKDVRAAVRLFEQLLRQFPFDGEINPDRAVRTSSFANAMSLMLTSFARDMLPLEDAKVPLFAAIAPAVASGTGKGLLFTTLYQLVTGLRTDPPASPLPEDESEIRKHVLAVLLQGEPFVYYDNVDRLVDSAALASALTTGIVHGRILGVTRDVNVPNSATWLMTGNNLRFSKEHARRVVPIRLDAKMENPDTRSGFDLRLPGWVHEQRSALVSAALTLIRYWVGQGRPEWSGAPMATFEPWSRMIGGILETSGVAGFLSNRTDFRLDNDEESQQWRGFVAAWFARWGTKVVPVSELILDATEHLLTLRSKFKTNEVRAVSTLLGMELKRHHGQTIGEYRITWHQSGAKASGFQTRNGVSLEPLH
jgi:hypothetical protein